MKDVQGDPGLFGANLLDDRLCPGKLEAVTHAVREVLDFGPDKGVCRDEQILARVRSSHGSSPGSLTIVKQPL